MASSSGIQLRDKCQQALRHRLKDGGPLGLGGFWENWSGAGLLWERRLLVSRRMVDEVDHTDALVVARAGRSRATPVKTMLWRI
jgi:hypothetical protein